MSPCNMEHDVILTMNRLSGSVDIDNPYCYSDRYRYTQLSGWINDISVRVYQISHATRLVLR